MEKRNSFIESLKVDKATLERINAILRDATKNSNVQTGKSKNSDDGGRERGDTGPGSLGRESGNKSGGISNGQSESSGEHGAISQGSSGHGSSDGHGSDGGHSSDGGHGSGGGHGPDGH